jgi:Outer membrane protein beta-barrel domain
MSARRTCMVFLYYCVLTLPAFAQARYNFNVGAGPGFPLSTASDFVKTSFNLNAGGGINLNPHLKLIGEFMYEGLPVKQSVIDELDVSDVTGKLYVVSGSVMGGTSIGRGRSIYAIGGGGWYHRTLDAKQKVLQEGTKCEPAWIWWDVQCVDGIFPTTVTVASRTSSAPGFNVGGGIAFRIGSSRANIYTEVRYHRAFTKDVDTTVLPLTFGVRW